MPSDLEPEAEAKGVFTGAPGIPHWHVFLHPGSQAYITDFSFCAWRNQTVFVFLETNDIFSMYTFASLHYILLMYEPM